MILQWLHSPHAQTLGWTLLHSLWQLSAIATAIAPILFLLRHRSANARYLTACLGITLMLATTIVSYIHLRPPPSPRAAITAQLIPSALQDLPDDPLPTASIERSLPSPKPLLPPATPLLTQLQQWLTPRLPYAATLYLAGTLLLALRMATGYTRLRLLTRRASAARADAQSTLTRLMNGLAISRTIRLLESAAVEVPTVLGILQPAILLPASALTGLTPGQLSALLAHELAHIRRHDHLANLAQSIIDTLLFYHPAVWWLSARIRQERENCCDDLAISLTGNRLQYAAALAAMESLRATPPHTPANLALAARTGVLLPRIHRLLGLTPPTPRRRPIFAISTAITILVLLATLIYLGCNRQPDQSSTPPTSATPTIPNAQPAADRATQPALAKTHEPIVIESRVLLVSRNFLDDFRIGWMPPAPNRDHAADTKRTAATLIDDWTLNLLLTSAQNDKHSYELPIPRITTPNDTYCEAPLREKEPKESLGPPINLHQTLGIRPAISVDRRYIVMAVTPPAPCPLETTPPTTNPTSSDHSPSTLISMPTDATLLLDGGEITGLPTDYIGQPADPTAIYHMLILIRPHFDSAPPTTAPASALHDVDRPTGLPIGSSIGPYIPYQDLMIYPDNWVEATRNPQTRPAQVPVAENIPAPNLDGPVLEIVAENQRLEPIINYLRDTSNINIFVNWKALDAAGIDRNTPVTLNLQKTTFREVLKAILQSAGDKKATLGYTIDEGIITISTKEDLESQQHQLVRVYDIRDLLLKPQDQSAPFATPADTPNSPANRQAAETSAHDQIVKDLITMIEATVAPDSWRDHGGKTGAIRELNGQLVVNQTLDNQKTVISLLTQLRDARSVQVGIESRLILVDDAIIAALPKAQTMPAAGPGAATAPAAFIDLDDRQLTQLFATIDATSTAVTLTAPRITLFNGQRGAVAMTNQQNYVANCKAKPDKNGKLVPDMEIKTVTFGTAIELTATASADRKQVLVDLKPTIRQLVRMELFPAPNTPGGDEFFIEKPILNEATMSTICSVPDGHTIVLTGLKLSGDFSKTAPIPQPRDLKNPSPPAKERQLLVLMRPTLIVHHEIDNESAFDRPQSFPMTRNTAPPAKTP